MSHCAAIPPNEPERLARLHALEVLDSGPEALFDALTQAAAEICGTPIALLSLVDAHRQWFKSTVGFDGIVETPRDIAFCAHTLLGAEVLQVDDASQDERFADNPLVTGPANIRFYAGAPITLSDGSAVGSLCVLDHQARQLGDAQLHLLRHLASACAEALQSRQRTLESLTNSSRADSRLAELYHATPAMLHSIDTDGKLLTVSDTWLDELGYGRDAVIGRHIADFYTADSRRHALETIIPRLFDTGRCDEVEYDMVRQDGTVLNILLSSVLVRDAEGRPLRSMGASQNVTRRRKAEFALRESQAFLARVGQVAGVGGWELDLASGALGWSEQAAGQHAVRHGRPATLREAVALVAPASRPVLEAAIERARTHAEAFDLELPIVSLRKNTHWLRVVASVESGPDARSRLVGAFQDVTRRKQMEQDLARSRELLLVTLDSIGDAVITTDTAGIVQWLNPVAERMTGWAKSDAVGRPSTQVFVIVDEETGLPVRDPVAACLDAARSIATTGRITLISKDGAEYGIEDTASPIRERNGQVHGTVLVFHDVSEQRRLHREMSHRATHDLLTGLVNRSEFEARIAELLDAVGPDHAVLYIDLDQFKLVNDACGHAAGDQLLQQVSAILRGCVRDHDTLARLGGDEFGVILEHCGMAHGHRVAQKICDQMDEFRFVHDGRRFRIGTSIGLVPVDNRWTGTKALLQAADASCYAAKDGGRNRVHAWFDSDQALKARDGDMQWVSRLEMALDEDRFELFGQRIEPIDGDVAGLHFEVLLRLREASGVLVPPGAFLPVAERFHLATRIDRWVVRHAFDWMRIATDDAVDIDMVSVNLSGQSLGDRAFHRDVIQMIRHARFDVRKLCFEITETAAITHLAEARTFIVEMRSLGVRIALDDFGAGASSFGYLKSLPVDFLKIDGHFITSMLEDKLNHAAVRCFCDVAKVVGVRTIAEFVEREDVRGALRALGVDMAQGYLIHRPEPLTTLLACVTA